MTPALETSRPLLRPLEIANAKEVQMLFPHWEIVCYSANRVLRPYPPDGAYAFYRDAALSAVERGDPWHWTLRLKSNPAGLIGGIRFLAGKENNRAFWFGFPWQGQGLISEASEVVTDNGFDTLRFSMLRVPKVIAKIASRRISQKQGMRVVAIEEREYVSGRLASAIWEIAADEWHALRRPK